MGKGKAELRPARSDLVIVQNRYTTVLVVYSCLSIVIPPRRGKLQGNPSKIGF